MLKPQTHQVTKIIPYDPTPKAHWKCREVIMYVKNSLLSRQTLSRIKSADKDEKSNQLLVILFFETVFFENLTKDI